MTKILRVVIEGHAKSILLSFILVEILIVTRGTVPLSSAIILRIHRRPVGRLLRLNLVLHNRRISGVKDGLIEQT